MTCCHRALGLSLTIAGVLTAGCAKAPPAPPSITIAAPADARVKAAMVLAAAADATPDAAGRPSPVVVRVYQLRTDAAFAGADFIPLFDDERRVGSKLIHTHDHR